MEVAGGRSAETPFHLDLVAEKGHLRLDGGAPRGFQADRIWETWDGNRQAIDEGPFAALSDAAVNVAGVYAALRDDTVRGTANVTDFADAVRLTRAIEDVLAAAQIDIRSNGSDRPVH